MSVNIYYGVHIMNSYESLVIETNRIMDLWKNSRGFAPVDTADKLEKSMIDLHFEMTKSLGIWIKKGLSMTKGELVLARVNIGAVVESWLKFFYCIYYHDYIESYKEKGNDYNIISKKGKMTQPEKLSFEKLKNFSIGKLWEDKSDTLKWIEKVQHQRNSIHYFYPKDIGTQQEFLNDIEKLYKFVCDIEYRLPPIEDFYFEDY